MAGGEVRVVSDAPLTSVSLARQIRDGLVDAEEVVRACLGRIDEAEAEVQAWAHLDADYAIQQAQQLDAVRGAADVVGPLHGLPVGVKDIFDTADLPTENGTVIDAGRQPEEDSFVVSQLKEAGAVILGKTVTTELAGLCPRENPEPAQSGAYARRVVQRVRGGGRSGHGAAGDWYTDQRLDHSSGRLLRRIRIQTHAWPDFPDRRPGAVAGVGYDWCLRPVGRGYRVAGPIDHGVWTRRIRIAACGRAPVCWRLLVRSRRSTPCSLS